VTVRVALGIRIKVYAVTASLGDKRHTEKISARSSRRCPSLFQAAVLDID
jgi:hypothetical protein